MIKELSIYGFRGFGEEQTIEFALPDGENRGSGITIITGANNAGKTTIVESIRAFNYKGEQSPPFSEGRRNAKTAGKVNLKLKDENEKEYIISSLDGRGSSTKKNEPFDLQYYVLQARRYVPYEFIQSQWNKDTYIEQSQKLENQRSSSLSHFEARIFQIEKDKEGFDKIIKKVLGEDFQWTVELRDSGKFYIKYSKDGVSHSSEGIGDGIWSIFTICAALFDAPKNSVIVIDEPELSVHPALQKKLMLLLSEYSIAHQIIICTHSPYFVSWEAIVNGAQLIRVVKDGVDSKCYAISKECKTLFKGILRDLNNPHTLGIAANEALFLEDRIILVEGQEDVVIFNKIAEDIKKNLKGNFFGWGVGGAAKMKTFLLLFRDLGYKKIVAIFDGDKAEEAKQLEEEFKKESYKFIILKEDDIRDKRERTINSKSGITSEKGKIKDEYREYAINMFDEINAALQ